MFDSLSSFSCAICTLDFDFVNLQGKKRKLDDTEPNHHVVMVHPCCEKISHFHCIYCSNKLRCNDGYCPCCRKAWTTESKAWVDKIWKNLKKIENDNVIQLFTIGDEKPEKWCFQPYAEVVCSSPKYKYEYNGIVQESVIGYSKIYYNAKDQDTWEENWTLTPVYKYFGSD